MFTKYILLATVATVVLGAPQKDVVPIVSQSHHIDNDGKFQWSYESADGHKAQQQGELKNVEKDHTIEIHHGSYDFKADDGKVYSVSYTADEFGYHPQGDHLPVAPEIPPEIARALAYLATVPPPSNTARL